MKYTIQAFTNSAKTEMIGEWSTIARDVNVENSERGLDTASAFITMSLARSFNFYAIAATPHLVINYESEKWSGRIEDIGIANGGIQINALGYWRALTDTQYTALWSDTSVRRWETVVGVATFTPERYQIDFNNSMYIAPRRGEAIDSSHKCRLGYRIPDKSSRDILEIKYTYVFVAPNATWQFLVHGGDEDWGSNVLESTTSGAASGSVTLTLSAPAQSVLFTMKYNSGTPTSVTDTGDVSLIITGIRVKTKTGTVTSRDIIIDMIAPIAADQLSQSPALIQDPGIDLEDAIFEDMSPADVLADLELRGDSNTPSRVWTSSVFDGQLLQFHPLGEETGRHWYIDISDIDLQRTIDNLSTSVYAKFADGNGRTLRTTTITNGVNVDLYGINRAAKVNASTTSATQAELVRDAELDERGEIQPRSGIVIRRLRNASGGSVPLIEARSGDYVTIRNLPSVGAVLNNIQTFTILRADLALSDGILDVVPSRDLPGIAALLAEALR